MIGAVLCAALPALAQSTVTLPVPAVTIYPGDAIAEGQIVDLAFTWYEPSTGLFEERAALVGKVARRTLLPGKPIPLNAVREPHAVSLGTTVLAVYRSGSLTITSRVQPLRAGAVGDLVEARNLDSGKIISGLVQADGTLRIGSR
ncbi:MAG: flagellar basal body P-ring formation chaperone FlgA [Parvibaculaceae bacterium]